MNPSRCLVLGGTGFIGSHVVERLLANGLRVRVFGQSSMFPIDISVGVDCLEFSVGDFHDAQSVAKAVKGCDYVFHLIATSVPASSNRNMVADADSNLIGTLKLLETCVREKVRQIIFSSSGGTVYGRTGDDPIPELHNTEPQCSYGVVKLAIEKYLELFRIQHGVDYTVLRVSNCYGPGLPVKGEQGVVGVFLDRLRRQEPITVWGNGAITRDYVYVADVAAAFRAALGQQSPFRVFNIGTGVGTSIIKLIEMMERVTGCRANIVRHPAREVDVPVNVLDPTRARNYLRWDADTALEQGLLNTWNWMHGSAQANSARALSLYRHQ